MIKMIVHILQTAGILRSPVLVLSIRFSNYFHADIKSLFAVFRLSTIAPQTYHTKEGIRLFVKLILVIIVKFSHDMSTPHHTLSKLKDPPGG